MRLRWDRKDEQEREGTSLSNCNITAVAVVILVIKGAAEIVNLGMCSVSKLSSPFQNRLYISQRTNDQLLKLSQTFQSLEDTGLFQTHFPQPAAPTCCPK